MTVADTWLRAPEVARRLGVLGAEVYELIFVGELDGQPDRNGIVHVTEASVRSYLNAHGGEDGSSRSSRET